MAFSVASVGAAAYSYACNCSDTGFQGTHCEINIDDCRDGPCQNEATCTDLIKVRPRQKQATCTDLIKVRPRQKQASCTDLIKVRPRQKQATCTDLIKVSPRQKQVTCNDGSLNGTSINNTHMFCFVTPGLQLHVFRWVRVKEL